MADKTFAVIKTGGKQYIVAEGDLLKVEKLDSAVGTRITFGEVLLFVDNGEATIGTPMVNGALVEAEVTEQVGGRKVTTIKFKPKVRYYKKMGFRPLFTKVRVTKINRNTLSTLTS